MVCTSTRCIVQVRVYRVPVALPRRLRLWLWSLLFSLLFSCWRRDFTRIKSSRDGTQLPSSRVRKSKATREGCAWEIRENNLPSILSSLLINALCRIVYLYRVRDLSSFYIFSQRVSIRGVGEVAYGDRGDHGPGGLRALGSQKGTTLMSTEYDSFFAPK